MAELSLDMQSVAWADLLTDAEAQLQRAIDAVMVRLVPHHDSVEVSVVLTDDATMQHLNKTYRGQEKPTNVLSFPSGMTLNGDAPVLLGDLVLTHETIAREAAQQGKSFLHHTLHLAVHGVLHLLAFDHETDADASDMEALEVSILADLGVNNPYQDNHAAMEPAHG